MLTRANERLHIEIAERKRAEESLRRLKEFNEDIVQNMAEGIVVQDVAGIYTFINPAAATLLGYTPEELVGQHWSIIIPPDQQPIVRAADERRTCGEIDQYELELLHRDGTRVPVLVGGSPRFEDGRFAGTLAVFTDITERKRAEESLRRLKEFNEGIVQNVAEGIAVEDAAGYFTFVNPAKAAMLGYTPEELVGQHWTVIVPPDQQPIVQAADERRARGETDQYELELVRKDGARLPVLVSGSPRFEGSRFAGSLVVFTDITKRKRAEEDLRRRGRALALLNRVGQELSATLDLQQVFERLLPAVTEIISAEGAAVWLWDREQAGWLVCQAVFHPGVKRSCTDLRLYPGQGVTGWVAQHGESTVVTPADPRFLPVIEEHTGFCMTSMIAVPLRVRGATIGVLEVVNKLRGDFDKDDLALIETLTASAAIAIDNARLFEEVQRLAVTDELTGVYNRRYFEQQLRSEFQRARRYARPLALLMLDLDYFKPVNDCYGHMAGDAVLAAFAALVRANVRETDVVTRYGGDEFAVILPETDLAGALSVAEKVLRMVAAHPITYEECVHRITVSGGAVALPDLNPADRKELVRLADQALYRAKQQGRNRVCAACTNVIDKPRPRPV